MPDNLARSPSRIPVVIVGAGPTGLVLAHLLGVQGVRTLLIDREAGTVGEARAVTIDDESLRSIQATGHLDAVLPHITQGYGVHYYSWRQRLFARISPTFRCALNTSCCPWNKARMAWCCT